MAFEEVSRRSAVGKSRRAVGAISSEIITAGPRSIADPTNKSGQLRRVLSTYLGLQDGEAIFTKHPILGPDCCNDKRATISPLDKSAKGAMPALLESGTEIAVAFQRLLGEYFDIVPL